MLGHEDESADGFKSLLNAVLCIWFFGICSVAAGIQSLTKRHRDDVWWHYSLNPHPARLYGSKDLLYSI